MNEDVRRELAEMDRLMVSDQIAALRREIDQLHAWKAQAIEVLGKWDRCYEVLDYAGYGTLLGQYKSDHVLLWIESILQITQQPKGANNAK